MKRALHIILVVGVVGLVHLFYTDTRPAYFDQELESQWGQFQDDFAVGKFGEDGFFLRAVRNGYAVFFKTYAHASRFTRKVEADAVNSCASCHSPKFLAYAFVSSDRFDSALNKRVSFEERIMRCYVKYLDGFVPTIYDPAVRDLRIFARVVAHRYRLTEGQLPSETM